MTSTATARTTSATGPDTTSYRSPYQSYVYAYPHKTAYERLEPRPALRDVWARERTDALALYLHVPFCEVRCGFCNLFTRVGAPDGLTTAYLDALERQSGPVREALGERPRFAAAAFGGGTPTFLTAAELERLCDVAERRMGADLRAIPLSVETSPPTATADRLAVLADRGATRLSIGVQSFVDAEARTAVRPQRRADVEAALGRIRDSGVPVLNIDLIYGIEGQTAATWRHSLDAALAWEPEELYLYPLYVRPLTGLGRSAAPGAALPQHAAGSEPDHGANGEPGGDAGGEPGSGSGGGPGGDPAWDEQRLTLYRQGRDHLLAHGYEQVSMRMFRRIASSGPSAAPSASAPDHACQTDGMVGLGCGARSYTSALHYSFDYAVDMREIRAIIDDYVSRPARDFAHADFGRRMDGNGSGSNGNVGDGSGAGEGGRGAGGDEARRRYLLQSVLQAEGMTVADYAARFGGPPAEHFPAELADFAGRGWLDESAAPARLRLSAEGLAHSDAVGPALFSPAVRAAMAAYDLK